MDRQAREFLTGFQRAAILAQRVLTCPPAYVDGAQYLEDVAHLHAGSDELVQRGLVVGCLSAIGKA